jgi:hypothetical protein
MARKIISRKRAREEAEAAERREELEAEDHLEEEEEELEEDSEEEEDEEEDAVVEKKPVKRKSRAKPAKSVRLKAFWGVFSQTLRRVACFEYGKRAEAEKKAAELTATQKTPHFVQLVKEVIEE